MTPAQCAHWMLLWTRDPHWLAVLWTLDYRSKVRP